MNVSTGQSVAANAAQFQQSALTGLLQSLGSAANPSPSGGASTLAVGDLLSTLSNSSDSMSAASGPVQNALSYTQAASGYLGQITGLLKQMATAAQTAGSSTASASAVAAARSQYAGDQTELRSLVGGTTAQIGGTSDVSPAGASYDGAALFGSSSSGLTVATGVSTDPSVTVPGTDLSQGAILSLIQQDSSGNFTAGASDSTAASTVAAALQQISTASDAIGQSQTQLGVAATAIEIGSENLASALLSPDSAAAATQAALSFFGTDTSSTLLSQDAEASQTALSLLE